MKRNILPSVSLVVGLMLGGLLISVQAEAIPLDDLIRGASLTQGDKQFDNFSLSDPNPNPDVFVEGTTVNGQHGFVISGSALDELGEVFNTVLEYSVTIENNLGLNIHGVTSTFSFTGDLAPSASMTTTNEFFADAGHTMPLGSLMTGTGLSTASTLLSRDIQQLFVRLSVSEVGPLSTQFGIQTTFAQAPVGVPEPTSLILLGSGLIGLAIWRRKYTA